jgi:hypothetical protein
MEKCRLFQIVRRTIKLTGRNATKSQQNMLTFFSGATQMENSNGKLKWRSVDFFKSSRVNKTLKKLTFFSGATQMENSNGKLKWKTQMEKCRLFQIVRRTIKLTGRNATKSQQNT